jgi:hypothetical protein
LTHIYGNFSVNYGVMSFITQAPAIKNKQFASIIDQVNASISEQKVWLLRFGFSGFDNRTTASITEQNILL